jgi:hypothetical protein
VDALSHADHAKTRVPAESVGRKSVPVVLQLEPQGAAVARKPDADPGRTAVLRHVPETLLQDAIEAKLHVAGKIPGNVFGFIRYRDSLLP